MNDEDKIHQRMVVKLIAKMATHRVRGASGAEQSRLSAAQYWHEVSGAWYTCATNHTRIMPSSTSSNVHCTLYMAAWHIIK